METIKGKFHTNERRPLELSAPSHDAKKAVDNNSSPPVYVNHAATAWQESRRKWIGDKSQRSKKISEDPIISWSMTYEDLLSTNEPFSEPIPLPEMVDFLVDIWYDEGLFD